MAKRRLARANGFSIVELMVAVGLLGIVSLFVAEFGFNFSKNTGNIQKFVEQSSLGSFGVRVVKLAETADLSSLFIHLPVSAYCSSLSLPCLQKIDPTTSETSAFTSSFLPKNFEFYRDTEGVFATMKASSQTNNATFDANFFINKNLTDTAMTATVNQASVVWPLVNTSSPEFPVFTRSASDISFSFVSVTASSSSSADAYVLTTYIAGKSGSLSDLLGVPVVIYNPYYPQHYVVQYLSEIIACRDDIASCKKRFPAQTTLINDNYVMIKLKEITATQYTNFAPNLKNYATFSSTTSGDWSYLFPTKTPNLKASTAAGSADLSYPLSIAKWAHFYDANAMNPHDLFIMPVRWSVYFLKAVANKPEYFSLMRRDFNGLKALSEVPEISFIKGTVMFSRKIGTKNLKFSVYGEAE